MRVLRRVEPEPELEASRQRKIGKGREERGRLVRMETRTGMPSKGRKRNDRHGGRDAGRRGHLAVTNLGECRTDEVEGREVWRERASQGER